MGAEVAHESLGDPSPLWQFDALRFVLLQAAYLKCPGGIARIARFSPFSGTLIVKSQGEGERILLVSLNSAFMLMHVHAHAQ